jgi:hypothetical protein
MASTPTSTSALFPEGSQGTSNPQGNNGGIKTSPNIKRLDFRPDVNLYQTTNNISFSGNMLNVKRYTDHPAYDRLGFSPFRDNDIYYNENTHWTGDFGRMLKNFWPGFKAGFVSNYSGFGTLVGGDALNPSALDVLDGYEADEAASRAMSTRGGWQQSMVNIPFNLNYTAGIITSIALEDLALTALAPETAGGSLAYGAYRTGKGLLNVARSLKNIATATRAVDRVNEARKIYNTIKSVPKAATKLVIPQTAQTWRRSYQALDGLNEIQKVGRATQELFTTGKGFASAYMDLRQINLAIDESSVEALSVRRNLLDEYVDEYVYKNGVLPVGEDYQKMKDNADKAMTADYFANLPVIYLTNKITFGNASFAPRFIKNWATVAKTNGGRILMDAVKGKAVFKELPKTFNPVTYVKRLTNKQMAKNTLYNTAKYFKSNFSEGVQELYQMGAAGSIEDYYRNIYDDPQMTGYRYYKQSARKAIGDLYSQEGFEAFAGGLLGGGLSNVVSRGTRAGKEFIMKSFNPNTYEQYRTTQKENMKNTLEMLNSMGDNVKDFLAPDLVNLVEALQKNKEALKLVEEGNFKGVEDIRSTSLYQKIQQLESVGATETFIEALEQMKQLEADEKMEAFGVDSVEKADQLIDTIAKRTQSIQKSLKTVNTQYENPYNPNQYEIGTKERNEEILKQFAYEQAKRDLAFNLHQFRDTADRLSDIYEAAKEDSQLSEFTNKEFSVLFNTTLSKAKKSGVAFESSLENEIAYIFTENKNAVLEIANIEEQLESADAEGKRQLEKRKQELTDQIAKRKKISDVLVDYAAAIDKVRAARNGDTELTEKDVVELKKAFDNYISEIAAQKGTPVNINNRDKVFDKLVDYFNVAQDQRLAANAITILSDPGSLQQISDLHFEALANRFNNSKEMSKNLARAFVMNKLAIEVIEALEEIGVAIPVEELQAFLLEDVRPTKFLTESKTDADANGFVIEGSPLWEKIQEIMDQYEVAAEDIKSDTETTTEEEVPAESEEAMKAEGEAEAEAAEETKEKKPSMTEQAAKSQQATKEAQEKQTKRKKTTRAAAKYQEVSLRKELGGTKVLEKLDEDFAKENERRKEAGERQQTFTQFINGLSNIDSLVKQGRNQAGKIKEKQASEKTVERYQKRLDKAKTVEDVDLIEMDILTLPIMPEDLIKLDFQKRRNEIMAEEAKKRGVENVPEPTPKVEAPQGENLEQATETVESIDFNKINTAEASEKGGEVTDDDINNILC